MNTRLTSKDLSQRLSTRLANFKMPDDVISKLADRVLIDGLEFRWFNPCIYGICIDYFTDRIPKLDGILSQADVTRLEVFPYGIPVLDRFHIRVGYAVPGLEGRVSGGFR